MNCSLKIYVGWGLKIVGGGVIHMAQALYSVSALCYNWTVQLLPIRITCLLIFLYCLCLKSVLSLQVRVWGAVTYRRLGHIPLIPECGSF